MNTIPTLEHLQGYLNGVADMSFLYDHNASLEISIKDVERLITPLDTIVAAHHEWEKKYLAEYEFEIVVLHDGYKGLEAIMNNWCFQMEFDLIDKTSPEAEVNAHLSAVQEHFKNSKTEFCEAFSLLLHTYIGEEVAFYDYYLKTFKRKRTMPSNYGFTFIGNQLLLYGESKAVQLKFEVWS